MLMSRATHLTKEFVMIPAQGKPGRVPSAPGRARHVTPHIRTLESAGWGGLQRAQYKATTRLSSPEDAPLIVSDIRHRWISRGEGAWVADVVLTRFARTEILALTSLVAALRYWDIAPAEATTALAVVDELAQSTPDTPWDLRPFGIRGKRPAWPKRRVALPDGKTVLVHQDTLQPHRDPDCRCEACMALAPIRRPT